VVCHQGAIDLYVTDAVPSQAASCLCMMESSIGITLAHRLMFSTLFPVCGFSLEGSSKAATAQLPNMSFIIRKLPIFLKEIEEHYKKFAVLNKQGRRPDTPRPYLCRRTSSLEAAGKAPSSIHNMITTSPGVQQKREEILILEP
jgi:hypothetical protein